MPADPAGLFEVIHHLEMRRPTDLRHKRGTDLEVRQARLRLWSLNRWLHGEVGRGYWFGREGWTTEDWQRYTEREGFETWLGYLEGTPVGYFELVRAREQTRIKCFGLFAHFVGRGLGAHLLTEALERAWQGETQKVVLDTCNLDHPAALPNYLARGMQLARTERLPLNPASAAAQAIREGRCRGAIYNAHNLGGDADNVVK